MLYFGAKKSILSAGKTLAQQIAALFSNTEQGAWYEPSLTNGTLFQDSAGTLPVTAVGQPVGLMLDKRLGLVLGTELTTNGRFDFDMAGWFPAAGGTITWDAGTAVCLSPVDSNVMIGQSFPVVVGRHYLLSYDKLTGESMAIYTESANSQFTAFTGRQQFVVKASGPTLNFSIAGQGAFSTGTMDNLSCRLLDGNHAVQPTAINRPVLQIDGNGKYYLAFNGTNSWMSTSAIDFTATDKMTVVPGVRKLSDAPDAIFLELSEAASGLGNTGSFYMTAPEGAGGTYKVLVHGAVPTSTGGGVGISGHLAPVTNVLVAAMNLGIAPPSQVALRVNGAVLSATPFGAVDGGSGNFGTYPLYIGTRAVASLFFNGNLYGLIVRGALSSASQVASAERYMNAKTGAY